MSVALRIALGLALLACLTAAAPASARRDVPPDFYGVVYDGAVTKAPLAVQEQQFARMAQAGVESVRAVFSWADAQPTEGLAPDLTATDQLVALATEHGMSILPVVIYTPKWARADASTAASPPQKDSDYVRYLQALDARYGTTGSFWSEHPELQPRPIRYWQIWNEPHLRLYWNASKWEKNYGALLRASHDGLRALDPQARIVLAGLTGTSWDALASLYKLGSAKGAFDVAGLQTYTGSPRNLLRAVHLFRGVLTRHGQASLPLWLTEMGWPAAQGRTKVPSYQRTIATTDSGMAKRLRGGYETLIAKRKAANVRVSRVYWYTWASSYKRSSDATTGIFRFAGLSRFDGTTFTQRPALAEYVKSARRHEGCKKAATGLCQ
jgi:hypothetical protein